MPDNRDILITIITICYNNIADVQRTIASVNQQEHKPYEHIIIDGSTNTEIKDWITTTPQQPYLKSYHEADNGISDAFNKGIAKSTGNFIQFLNSGDVYHNDKSLHHLYQLLYSDDSVTWVHGAMEFIRIKQLVKIGKPFNPKLVYRGMRSTFHPTMLVAKALFVRYGNFNTVYKYAMDYDFLIRIANEKFAYTDEVIVNFDTTGVSSSNFFKGLRELRLIYERAHGKSIKQLLWHTRLIALHLLSQTLLGKYLYKLKMNRILKK